MTLTQSDAASNLSPTRSAPRIETHGIDVIAESERKGKPRDLFWPWAAGNISVVGVSMGGYVFGFGLSFWQGLFIAAVGTALSFLLVGIESLSGQKGSAPTLVLSRAAFGVYGNAFGGVIGYLLMVGWEIVLCSMSVLAVRTVLGRYNLHSLALDVTVFVLVIGICITFAVLGFDAIMRAQKYLTIATLVITAGFIAVTWRQIHLTTLLNQPSGGSTALIGAFVMVLAGFGVGWATAGADYSRYLPRNASLAGNVFWTTFGGTLPVALLVAYGFMLCGSSPQLSERLGQDPIGALTSVLPTWFLIPFLVVALLGLIAGIILDIYSSGFALLSMGVPMPRWAAALVDGAIMTVGAIYVVWFAPDFITPFQAFLYTVGVPLSAWAGIYVVDMMLRWRVGYHEEKLFDASPSGYGTVRWGPLLIALVGTVIGLGLVTSPQPGFTWEGFLLGPLGLGGREGAWAYSNIGVIVALGVTALGYAAWWFATGQTAKQVLPELQATAKS